MKRLIWVAGLAVLLAGSTPLAAEPEGVTPELPADPDVMAIIDGLGDNESATLPALKTTGDINDVARRFNMHTRGPGSRDYSIKMVWMPDRERAIFFGANHGSPHRTNDVWEYDLPSNTWVCLFGPDLLRGEDNWAKYLDRDSLETGIPKTRRGGPAIVPHTWWQMAYDPNIKAMLTFCSWSMVPGEVREAHRKGNHHPPLWAFYPEQKKWVPITDSRFEGRRPRYHNASALEYVPSLGKTVWCANGWANRGMWTYESATNTWTDMEPNDGDRQAFQDGAPAPEQVMVVLPDRNMLVGHRADADRETGHVRGRTSHYCVEKNEWTVAVRSAEDEINMPVGHDARTNFAYDQVGKVALLWDPHTTNALWAYDPVNATWTKLEPDGPPPPRGHRDVLLAYYDVARNVFVIPGMWVYRYKAQPTENQAERD